MKLVTKSYKNAFLLSSFIYVIFFMCLFAFASTTEDSATIALYSQSNLEREILPNSVNQEEENVLAPIKCTEKRKPYTMQENMLLDSYNLYAEEDDNEEREGSKVLLYIVIAAIGSVAGLFLHKHKTGKTHKTKELDGLLNKVECLNNKVFPSPASGISDEIIKEVERDAPAGDKKETMPEESVKSFDEPENIKEYAKEDNSYESGEDLEEKKRINPEKDFD
ncbi:MAG: hypothetical protein U9R24_07485, partial [Thermodesulfobacteriota bacterium]|nr:hypothetical protein [Thermodesulfobacteriota bacterium]